MTLVKIRYENCEEKGQVELEITCPPSEHNAVKQFINEFKKKEPFFTSAHNFIAHLKKYGFEAKEVEYDIEVY